MKTNNTIKRIIGMAAALAMTASFVLPSAAMAAPRFYRQVTPFAQGTPGVRANPVKISTAIDFMKYFGNGATSQANDDNTYELTANIDLSGFAFEPMPEFKGTLKSENTTDIKSIENLVINMTTLDGDAAFVQRLTKDAVIKDVTFDSPKITGGNAAAVVAGTSHGGDIENVKVNNATIFLTDAAPTAGGLVGTYQMYTTTQPASNIYGSIKNSVFTGTITDKDNQPISSQANIGGIIGNNTAGSISSTYVSNVYWDMDTTPGVNKVIGGRTGTVKGAVGVKFKDINIIEDETVKESALVEFTENYAWPERKWTGNNADHLEIKPVNNNSEFFGKKVGSSPLKLEINTFFEKSTTINVVAEKGELQELVKRAKRIYAEEFREYYNDKATEYNKIHTEIAAAQIVLDTPDAATSAVKAAINALNGIIGVDNATENGAVTILRNWDKQELSNRIAGCADKITNADGFERTEYQEFLKAYQHAKSLVDSTTIVESDELRDGLAKLNEAIDALKPILNEVTIERLADSVEIVVPGFKNSVDYKLTDGYEATVAIGNRTFRHPSSQASPMVLSITKADLGSELFNTGGDFKITLKDDTGTITSATATAKLEPAENLVQKDVKNVIIGKVDLGKNLSDIPKEVGGISLTYDPQTGKDGFHDAKGSVVQWEFNNDALKPEEDNPPAGGEGENGGTTRAIEQTMGTTGIKHIKGVIANSTGVNGKYTNPDGKFMVYGTVEVLDRTALTVAITEAGTYKEGDYTKDSWAILRNALNIAKATDASGASTQAQITKAADDLNNAINGLLPQPKIVLKQKGITLKIGEFFEPLTYVTSVTDISNDKIIDRLQVRKGDFVIWQDGVLVNPLPTGTETTHSLVFSVTNDKGVTASETMTVNVVNATGTTGSTSSSSTSSSGGGSAVISPGNNTVSNGDVSLDFTGTDIFTKEEIDKGAKLVLEVSKVTDDTNIKNVLDKIAKLLKGEVSIDGIYNIKIFKEIDGKKSSISNGEIRGNIGVYLPISQKAIDSKDNAVIHVLDNGGFEMYRGSVQQKDNKNVTKVMIKGFSEFAVVFGGNVADAADNLDTTGTTASTATTVAPNGTTTNAGGNGGTNAGGGGTNGNGGSNGSTNGTNQGGGEDGESTATTETSLVKAAATGDSSKIWLFVSLGLMSAAIAIGIAMNQKKTNNK